jgi:hypothetical protein
MVWIAPGLCFFTFIFFKFVNSGYMLLLFAPACVWLGSWWSRWYAACAWSKPVKLALVGLCVAINVTMYLELPLYCSYRSVRRFEGQLLAARTAVLRLSNAEDTVIIAFDSHFLGYRHAGYYLPAYFTIQYPEVRLNEGIRVFAMRNRSTGLFEQLPAGPSYRRFVLFPLPDDDPSYEAYLAKVKQLLPAHELETVRIGDKDLIFGSMTLLPLLFPHTATAPQRGVYPSLHSRSLDVNSREHQTASADRSPDSLVP